jgi:hypothetical protein
VRLEGLGGLRVVGLGDGADAVREVGHAALELAIAREHLVHQAHVVLELRIAAVHAGHRPHAAHHPAVLQAFRVGESSADEDAKTCEEQDCAFHERFPSGSKTRKYWFGRKPCCFASR